MTRLQYNNGLDNNLFFFRDRSQHEVDLVQEDGMRLCAYEIKLSSSIHPDFYNNLKYFRSLFPNDTVSTQVINTGAEENSSEETGHRCYLNV